MKDEPTPASTTPTIEQQLAGIHLRLGSVMLARAELEQLAATDHLDVAGLADLAEVRWRTGDLDDAAAAATAHLAGGGVQPIAMVIAAEAAAAGGRPGEARSHVAAVGGMSAEQLERQFAGMPRRAFWPSAPAAAIEALEAFSPTRGGWVQRPTPATAPESRRAEAEPSDDQGPGLWTDDTIGLPREAAPGVQAKAKPGTLDPADLMARGRADVRAGSPDRLASGLDRLALALRLDPAVAPRVLETLGQRHEPAALVLRGDACRILGRILEAEAAYLAAAATLGSDAIGLPFRP